MASEKLIRTLYGSDVSYDTIEHPSAFSSQATAEAAHVSGKYFAKPVILKVDGILKMAVLPAHTRVDLGSVKKELKAKTVELASEEEIIKAFPDCEAGGMPPFGNLYGMDVFIEGDFKKVKRIVFNAGNHRELITMLYSDYEKLVHPKPLKFAVN